MRAPAEPAGLRVDKAIRGSLQFGRPRNGMGLAPMRAVLAILLLIATMRCASAAEKPADLFDAMMAEIAGNCADLKAGGPGITANATALAIANILDNVALNQAQLFGSGAPIVRASILDRRYCLDRLLMSQEVSGPVHDRIAAAVASIFSFNNKPPDRSLDDQTQASVLPNAGRTDTPDSSKQGVGGVGADDQSVTRPLGVFDIKRFFPWPPARPSAQFIAPMKTVPPRTAADVYAEVEAKLTAAGYSQQYQFLAPGGFAIVNEVESIGDDGQPAANRWSKTLKRLTNFTVASLARAVFSGEVGHFRIVAIVLTNDPSPFRDVPITENIIDEWKATGEPFIPGQLLTSPITADHHLYYLIYELKSTKESVDFVPSSDLSGIEHLRAAGLLDK